MKLHTPLNRTETKDYETNFNKNSYSLLSYITIKLTIFVRNQFIVKQITVHIARMNINKSTLDEHIFEELKNWWLA